ncbi:bifunctional UDP-N-acetylglucosamine diphosphorylase/glucosamine-1-phosphate N-acetyltransferase GlmU [Rathayibacter sp. VKM Ac-2856]|uniref:bifunctional UDP-N-acetylglucosamine diphosphorylase/glucosamine-1-phosphate N-acetyltransferase GlmU n=1 Tax=unclassified Rathayibacter TaxID=2609250 RepID=UPI0015630899|nr:MULTISPECIES: bifunctional UDP-N-acetylglucosamine diphosphorylase/glucosamine-1-phosphate N-acetyltransferase GlmU [unclassified Rathayibacter]NQX06433.1 bifunctional UDP-N-acetylglucosamine diphosphorylase/glucosamine-1-phosphate N-acetyltransferase GlmU [Rathayibacter sp. VKM Ac-2858]NQX21600.1 bifunctional UDP-N-acetylglucosamine diphosphorylase/glucosamine-1-phosphate N-acetyltransferase GlmU [Rathayibacter sp. VKM Ac-2856]
MVDSTLAVVILAAGQGTRMKSRTPKVLHRLAGRPLLGHVLDTAASLDAGHVVTVVRHERERVAAAVLEHTPAALVVDQDEVPGTGRAVELGLAALPDDFDGTVVVLSADVPLLDAPTLRRLVDEHLAAANALTMLSCVLEDPTGFGRIVRGSDGGFASIVEQKDASDAELALTETNAGVYAFEAAALRAVIGQIGVENAQREKYLTDAAAALKAAGRAIEAVPVQDRWLVAGINDRAQLADAALELNARIVRRWQLEGVTVQDPATTWIDVDAVLSPDVEILPGTQIKGPTVIASGAVIGPDTTLDSCEIGEDAVVKRSDATLAVIGARAQVGPFSFLRPGTVLGERGKIGTYVETKNATIGAGSKVPHLSYVGDATIGEESNIGAGSIFANYDGVNKASSVVGSHVRAGSHNVFVAPVTIGDGAYTGAGTVIRKDIPAGALGITVAPQRNMAGWVQTHRPGTASATAAEAAQASEPEGTDRATGGSGAQ